MSDTPDSPAVTLAQAGTPCPAADADWAQALAMRRLQILGELAELGLEVARAVERQASGDMHACVSPNHHPPFQGDLALAYARVSRAVRLTLMLQAKLVDALKTATPEHEPDRASPEYRKKARVERIVERLAEAEHPEDEDEVTDLLIEAGERLDDEDLYGDLLDQPLSELVARLCKDLGLEPDWADLAQELWAVREIESGHVGRPLAGLSPHASSPASRGRWPGGPEGACLSDTG